MLEVKPEINGRLKWEIFRWLLTLAFLFGMAYVAFETKEGAQEKYVGKGEFGRFERDHDRRMNEIKAALDQINSKLDRTVNK